MLVTVSLVLIMGYWQWNVVRLQWFLVFQEMILIHASYLISVVVLFFLFDVKINPYPANVENMVSS